MTKFDVFTPENAPEKSRPLLKGVQEKLGFVPNVVGAMAESPATLKSWLDLKTNIEGGLLNLTERKIVHMTTSYLHNSGYCMAAGSTLAEKEGVDREIIDHLREEKPLKDQKLEQLRLFARAVLTRMGRPDDADIEAIRKAGYTNAQILEVILIISHGIMGNYVNHIVGVQLDKEFEARRFEERKVKVRMSDAA